MSRLKRLGGWIYDKICRRVDKVLLPLSGGRLSTGPGQTLLLRTQGAKSGRPRSVPLAYVTRGRRERVRAREAEGAIAKRSKSSRQLQALVGPLVP